MGPQSTARQAKHRRGALVKRERELSALADRQHGVISRKQLIAAGVSGRTIRRRIAAGRLHALHRSVYMLGVGRVSQKGHWLAAVLACGDGALLSHRSAAALWGFSRSRRGPIDVSAIAGRGRPGISVHEGGIHAEDRTVVAGIPVTTVARTLFDFAEVVDEQRLAKAFEEADRLHLVETAKLEAVCARGYGRRALAPIRRLIEEARYPGMARSPLEERVLALCREYDLPMPVTNVDVLGHEADAYWPRERLVVESDSYAYHGHRAAFEKDRARDAAMQAEGYRVIRVTHRRLEREPATIAHELRRLLDLGRRRAAA